jgi:DNA polymerase-3 subunit delta
MVMQQVTQQAAPAPGTVRGGPATKVSLVLRAG